MVIQFPCKSMLIMFQKPINGFSANNIFSDIEQTKMMHDLPFEPMEWSTMLMKKQSFFHMIEAQICQLFFCQTQNKYKHYQQKLISKENNINSTASQKELLCWNFWLCHQGFDSLQTSSDSIKTIGFEERPTVSRTMSFNGSLQGHQSWKTLHIKR